MELGVTRWLVSYLDAVAVVEALTLLEGIVWDSIDGTDIREGSMQVSTPDMFSRREVKL